MRKSRGMDCCLDRVIFDYTGARKYNWGLKSRVRLETDLD